MKKTLFLILILLLTACDAGVEEEPPAAGVPAQILCNLAYRSSVEVGIEGEDTLTFNTSTDDEGTITFEDLHFHALFSTGELDRERALSVRVTTADEQQTIMSALYQLPLDSGPVNQFIGGHGFTGLHYAYHPETGAELQFWCTAEPEDGG